MVVCIDVDVGQKLYSRASGIQENARVGCLHHFHAVWNFGFIQVVRENVVSSVHSLLRAAALQSDNVMPQFSFTTRVSLFDALWLTKSGPSHPDYPLFEANSNC